MYRLASSMMISVTVAAALMAVYVEASGSCASLKYTPSKSKPDILRNLKTIIGFSEAKIGQMEIQKKKLVAQMLEGERKSVRLQKEKVLKEARAADLTKKIAQLNVNVQLSSKRKNIIQARVNYARKSITAKTNSIRATARWIAILQQRARNAQNALNAAIARINREKAKRKCYFKIGKKRRRKRRRAWRVRIRIRARRIFREVRRVVRQVTRETKRLIRRLTPCIIDNLFSRLKRSKEKAQRARNSYNRQLLLAQRQKRIKEAELKRLILSKNALTRQLSVMQYSLSKLVSKLHADIRALAQNRRDLSSVKNRISNLKRMLANLEVQLKAIRQKKSDVLGIITVLKIETQKKIGDLKDLETADPDEVQDILDDIAEINSDIKKSVAKLRKILCG